MATMSFCVSKSEFRDMVRAIKGSELVGKLNTENPEIDTICDFLQGFMIEMENEMIIGHFDYELIIDGESISLDSAESDGRLKELIVSALT